MNNNLINFFNEVNLPEKYYEACITNNIITYFKERRNIVVYPFSVSPRVENEEGYDFGYELKGHSFLIQYKRPLKSGENFRWDIDIEQLKVIINNGYGEVTYYALPQFEDYKKWYSALNDENTKFLNAIEVFKYLNNSGKKSINSSWSGLKTWEQAVLKLFPGSYFKSAILKECFENVSVFNRIIQFEGMVCYEIE
jgi:hypothetical protein